MFGNRYNHRVYVLGEDERIIAWKKRLRLGWESDEDYEEALDRIYRGTMKALGLDPDKDTLEFPLPGRRHWPENPEILLGHSLKGLEIGVDVESLKRGGMVVVGLPGSGKTILFINLMNQFSTIPNVFFWSFATVKTNFRCFPKDHVLVVPTKLLHWNRWIEPPGTNPLTWHSTLADTVANVHGFLGKGRQILQETVQELDTHFRIGRDGDLRWNDLDLLGKMRERQRATKSFEERESFMRWIMRLESYEGYPEILAPDRSLSLAKMVGRNVVLEFVELPQSLQADIVASMLLYKLFWKRSNPSVANTVNVNCIDEASIFVQEGGKIAPFLMSHMKTGREFGECLVIGDQKFRNVSELIDIAQIVCIMQRSSFAVSHFKRSTDMTPGQREYLTRLEVGDAVVSIPTKPFVQVTVPFHGEPTRRSDEEITKEMAPTLEQFLVETPRAKYGSTTRTRTEGDLHHQVKVEQDVTPDEEKAQKNMLRTIAEDPLVGTQELFERKTCQ